MKLFKIILAMGSPLYVLACFAQAGPSTQAINAQNANNICRVYFVKPKPGAAAQLEQGRKKHMQFHKSQNDTWTWQTWSIETGLETGNYVTSTCGHAWKDFDDWEKRLGKADTADADVNMTPFEEGASNGFFIYRSDLSLAPADMATAPMDAVSIYVLHPGTADDFTNAVRQISDALSKQPDWPKTSGWLQLANGGEAPEYVLLNGRQSWADYAPLPKSVRDVLTDAYGQAKADELLKAMRDSTDHLYTETARYRPDLSYLPGK